MEVELSTLDRDNALIMILRNQTAIMRQLDYRLFPFPKSRIGWLADATTDWIALVEAGRRGVPLREPSEGA